MRTPGGHFGVATRPGVSRTGKCGSFDCVGQYCCSRYRGVSGWSVGSARCALNEWWCTSLRPRLQSRGVLSGVVVRPTVPFKDGDGAGGGEEAADQVLRGVSTSAGDHHDLAVVARRSGERTRPRHAETRVPRPVSAAVKATRPWLTSKGAAGHGRDGVGGSWWHRRTDERRTPRCGHCRPCGLASIPCSS